MNALFDYLKHIISRRRELARARVVARWQDYAAARAVRWNLAQRGQA